MPRRGFKCKTTLYEKLTEDYNFLVLHYYAGRFVEAIHNFELISEKLFRKSLSLHYETVTKANQAWRSCKGAIYEYGVFKALNELLVESDMDEIYSVLMGDEYIEEYKEHYVINNWNEIFPDADLLLFNKLTNRVDAIISCKTSVRERLTETAFWKRELERNPKTSLTKVFFVTTDKDNELKSNTNRYMLLHVIDFTFITNVQNYQRLMNYLTEKYRHQSDFKNLIEKIKLIDEFGKVADILGSK